MEREKVIVFFCDCDGTIDAIDKESGKSLSKMIDEKRKQYDADKAIIVFITNGEAYYYNNFLLEVYSLIKSSNIELGRCYFLDGFYDANEQMIIEEGRNNNKCEKINRFIGDLEFYGKEVLYVCYAEDGMPLKDREILNEALQYQVGKIEYFIPCFIPNKIENNVYGSIKENIDGVLDCFKKSIQAYQPSDYSDSESASTTDNLDSSYSIHETTNKN